MTNNMVDSSKVGMFSLDKGAIRDNVKMFAWDGVKECDVEFCPLSEECKYTHEGKCAVQLEYIQALYRSLLSTYLYLDEAMLFKIGMELVPLYVHLSRLQIVELSLRTPISLTDKGNPSIHPVYKEIRETLKTIQTIWKGMDLAFSFGENAKKLLKDGGSSVSSNPKEIDYERGDPDFYKKISQEKPSRKGVVR